MKERQKQWAKLLKLAWPLIIANSFWNLQITIDRIFLGQFSTDALAATIAVMGLFWTPMALVQQTAAYSMTFVAQYLGAKEEEKIGPAVWHALYLGLIGGALFMFFLPIATPLFDWIGHSEAIRPLEVEYFKALCYSALPTALIAAACGLFTGLGDTKTVMWVNGVALLANIFFDYLMIFGRWGVPAMGVAGAGYATTLANWVGALYAFYHLFKRDHEIRFRMRSGWRLTMDLVKRYLRYGVPSGLQWALEGLAFTVFLVIIGRMPAGDVALASSGIVVTILMLAILPAIGMAQAVSVLVGQHLGEGNPQKAVQDTWSGLQVALFYMVTMAISFALIPGFYLSWFHNTENAAMWQEVSIMVPRLLLFVACFTSFDCMNFIFSFALKGAGDTRFVSLIALTIPWPLMVLPTWLMMDFNGAIYWAWGAASAYAVLQSRIFWRRFVGGKWQKMSVIH